MTTLASGLTAVMLALPEEEAKQEPKERLYLLATYRNDYSKPFRPSHDLISLWLVQDGDKVLVDKFTVMYSPGKGDVKPDSLSVLELGKMERFLASKEWVQRSGAQSRSIVENDRQFDLIDQVVLDSFSSISRDKEFITQYSRTIVYIKASDD